MRGGYPILLDVTDRLIVIVGGGAVAARKAAGVLDAGARRVRCVAPVFCEQLPSTVERIAATYCATHLQDAGLVFAATNVRAVNDAVVADARRLGILVSRADSDDAAPGDFSTPAKFVQGPIVVTVSAGSAALATAIRDDLRSRLDGRFVRMAEAMRTLRPRLRESNLPPERRAEIFRDLASAGAMDAMDGGGIEALRDWIVRRHPDLNHA